MDTIDKEIEKLKKRIESLEAEIARFHQEQTSVIGTALDGKPLTPIVRMRK